MTTPDDQVAWTTLHLVIQRMDELGLTYQLHSYRPGVVMISTATPGSRWEVEIMPDGHVELERFVSDGTLTDEPDLPTLWREAE